MVQTLKNYLEKNLKNNHYLLKLINHFLPTFKMRDRTR